MYSFRVFCYSETGKRIAPKECTLSLSMNRNARSIWKQVIAGGLGRPEELAQNRAGEICSDFFVTVTENFHYVSEQSCGGLLTNISGVISSPNYPNNYPDNVTCTWKIAPEKSHVNLTIEDLMVSGKIKQTSVRRQEGDKRCILLVFLRRQQSTADSVKDFLAISKYAIKAGKSKNSI